MLLYHLVQTALLLGTFGVVLERAYTLLFVSRADAASIRSALRRARDGGRVRFVERLASHTQPAWVATLLAAWVGAPAAARRVEVGEAWLDIQAQAYARLLVLRGCAPIATALGFIGAVIHTAWVLHGDHGLLALQAGLVARIGLEGAVRSIALGVATSILALGSFRVLRAAAQDTLAGIRRVLEELETDDCTEA